MKLLPVIAAAVLAVPAVLTAPAKAAGTLHDFDPSNVPTTLNNQCYESEGGHLVCFYRMNGETYNVAVNDTVRGRGYPHVMTVNCETGRYHGYGPLGNEDASLWAGAFCESGRF